ncbi:MAG TPA: PAS domain S-box protein, partial [Desulfobulbus sp.]|nr:PAS domain S-box protein [Desulfobulbus sp.]
MDWKLVFNALGELALVLDVEQRVVAANDAARQRTGLADAELIGRRCYEILHCNQYLAGGCVRHCLAHCGPGGSIDVEVPLLDSVFLVSLSRLPDRERGGGLILLVARDIGARKRTEEELRKKNRALRTLSECNQLLVRARSEIGLVRDLCRILVELGGYRLAWVGYAMDDARKSVHPVAHYGFEDNYLESIDITWSDTVSGQGPTGTAIREQRPVTCRNILSDPRFTPWREEAKKRRYSSSIALPLVTDGRCLGALNLYSPEPDAFDDEETRLLTELADDLAFGLGALRTRIAHREASLALRASETKYRKLVETAHDAIFLADAETGIILDANRAAEKLLARPLEEIIGMHQADIHPPADAARYRRLFRRHVARGEILSEDIFVRNSRGEQVPVQVSANTFTLGGRRVIQGIFRNVSEIRAAEERVRHLQKMEAIATLAGGIAHDFNNILSPIIGYAEMALLQAPANSPLRADIERILDGASRARELVRQILNISRSHAREKRPTLLQPVVKEAVRFLRSTVPSSIELRIGIDPSCGPVCCDATRIHQVVMNLCTNAYQAMQERGGILEIRLDPVRVSGKGSLHEDPPPGEYVRLTVRDSGPGMEKAVLARIFEPYFTTRVKGEGTGLGLAVVHGIVEQYDGHIRVESDVGQGSVFEVYLPLAGDCGEAAAEEKIHDVPHGHGEHILLVDDDTLVADTTGRILESLDYRVTVLADAAGAWELFRDDPYRFDLVLTDQTMPHMAGTELAEKMLALRPGIPILLCTGYSPQDSAGVAQRIGIKGLLMKPLDRAGLAAAIAGALAGEDG